MLHNQWDLYVYFRCQHVIYYFVLFFLRLFRFPLRHFLIFPLIALNYSLDFSKLSHSRALSGILVKWVDGGNQFSASFLRFRLQRTHIWQKHQMHAMSALSMPTRCLFRFRIQNFAVCSGERCVSFMYPLYYLLVSCREDAGARKRSMHGLPESKVGVLFVTRKDATKNIALHSRERWTDL